MYVFISLFFCLFVVSFDLVFFILFLRNISGKSFIFTESAFENVFNISQTLNTYSRNMASPGTNHIVK